MGFETYVIFFFFNRKSVLFFVTFEVFLELKEKIEKTKTARSKSVPRNFTFSSQAQKKKKRKENTHVLSVSLSVIVSAL